MTIDYDDWKLTAYALGELDDADRAAIETKVARSPELQAYIEEIRATAPVVTDELKGTAAVGLTDAQRRWIEERASEGDVSSAVETGSASGRQTVGTSNGASRGLRAWWVPTSIAASIALIFGVWYITAPSLSRSRELRNQVTSADGLIYSSRVKTIGTPAKIYASDGWGIPAHTPVEVGPAEPGVLADFGRVAFVLTTQSGRDVQITVPIVDANGTQDDGCEQVRPPTTGDENEPFLYSSDEGRHTARQVKGVGTSARSVFGGGGGAAARSASQGRAVQALRSPAVGRKKRGRSTRNASAPDSSEDARRQLTSLGYLSSSVALKGRFTRSLEAYDTEGEGLLQVGRDQFSGEGPSSESYDTIRENPFLLVGQAPLSTFSIDVDTASYANVRRFLSGNRMPPIDAVRIEELINYFDYDYPQPDGADPFSVSVEIASCPWNVDHRLARIGIKGIEYTPEERPAANLVFLVDVSGSMASPNKLPLLQDALRLMVDELSRDDWVSMVVYAGASGLALPSTSCGNLDTIRTAISNLRSGGSTNGGAGIQLAYDVALDNFIEGGINRVILATDGDFNVGTTGQGDLTRLIEEKAKSGVFLSVLGFGMGNLKDSTLEMLADQGNGNYAYIDTINEARKVLVDQLSGTLITIAKDVKIQVEFNPAQASAYRLIGYENRMLAARDFNDDTKDAGEIGAGHSVTALYEIVPLGLEVNLPDVDPLKYQTVTAMTPEAQSGELMTVKLRFKDPDGDVSKLIELPIADEGADYSESSDDFAFAAAVASFGMLLRESSYAGEITYDDVIAIAEEALGEDVFGYRTEFVELVRHAATLTAEGS